MISPLSPFPDRKRTPNIQYETGIRNFTFGKIKGTLQFDDINLKMGSKLYSVYQPIVEIKTEKVLGYEALTRCSGRKNSPDRLFRKAYEKGSSVDLDLNCISTAVQILPKINKKELLFINLEPFTLCKAFVQGKQGEVLLKKISPYSDQIVFELTEGMKGRDFEFIRRGVRLLKKYGCRFAIDDVAGIGFKLFLLLSLKPHFVKIDISLVNGIAGNHFHRDLVHRIIELARTRGSRLIAEGLEKKADVEFVSRMGIHYVQGLYFSRPKKMS